MGTLIVAKRAKAIREDHLEKQETTLEQRIRIGKILGIPTPDAKKVRLLLARYEDLRNKGYIG